MPTCNLQIKKNHFAITISKKGAVETQDLKIPFHFLPNLTGFKVFVSPTVVDKSPGTLR